MFRALNKDMPLLRTLCLIIVLAFVLASPARAVQLQTSPATPASSTWNLGAFTLPDGLLPVICFGNGAPQSNIDDHCDECLQPLTNPVVVADTDNCFTIPLVSTQLSVNRRWAIDELRELIANPARAPPFS